MTVSPRLSIPLLDDAQSGKVEQANRAFRHIEAMLAANPLDRNLTAPPGSPTDGDCYIVGASATGEWSSHDGDLAYYRNGAWQFQTPTSGMTAHIDDEKVLMAYSDTESEWYPVQPQQWSTVHWTGRYWNSRKVMSKTVFIPALPTSGALNTAHGVANMEFGLAQAGPVVTHGRAWFAGGSIMIPSTNTMFSVTDVALDGTNVTITTNYAASALQGVVRIEYVETVPPE